MFGIVINKDNMKSAFVIIDTEGKAVDYKIKENEKIITTDWQIANTMLKPRWNGKEWEEAATQEEMKEYNALMNSNKKQPTTQEQINAQLLEEIAQQKIINAQLMQEIATLKGGNANV